MISAHYQWQTIPLEKDSQGLVNQLVKQTNCSPVIAKLLIEKGITTPEAVSEFIHPDMKSIHDPHLLHDIDKAVDRIQQAVADGERITIYGDYDADGITSTALMYETLQDLGADVHYYIPDRFTDGYGPNADAYKKTIDDGTKLIVTVDNGVSGKDVIDPVIKQGIDVVVTDHHEMPAELPNATAIVHPRFPGTKYPFPDLSGVGVAFKVAWALTGEFPEEMLDLVAIGEIADVVSVTDENRALISFGIQSLRSGTRPGLHALAKLANVSEQHLSGTDIAFNIAPRLNALGRVSNASQGVELLTTFDDERADKLAHQVETANDRRRQLVDQIMKEAQPIVQQLNDDGSATLIVFGHNWHQGVLGIIASRIVEQTSKPTIVASISDGEDVAKGSGRSLDGFDLFKALDGHRNLMTSFGGHPAACGLSFKEDDLQALQEALNDEADAQGFTGEEKPVLSIAGQIDSAVVNDQLYEQLMQLSPFGPGNDEPVFELDTDSVTDVRTMGQDNSHLKFKVGGVPVIAFNRGHLASQLSAQFQGPLRLAVKLSVNEWRGKRSIQLMLVDIQLASPVIIDQRTNHLTPALFNAPGFYVVYDQKLLDNIKSHLPAGTAISADQALSIDFSNQPVTVVDCPPSLASFEALFNGEGQEPSVVRLLLFQPNSVYLAGLPSRQDFAGLYRLLYGQRKINLVQSFGQLASYLKMNAEKLKFMINVFSDAGFVTIKDGILNLMDHSEKVDLTQTDHYLKMAAQYRAEKILLFSDSKEVAEWLFNCLNVK